MASAYITKEVEGHYPSSVLTDNIVSVEMFEDTLSPISVSSNSRAFLLGFYLKMVEVKYPENFINEPLKVPKSVIEILLTSTHKNIRIDWLILIVWHMVEYYGRSRFEELMKKYGNDFDNLYLSMNEPSRMKMTQNMLAYGSSIKDYDTLLFERI